MQKIIHLLCPALAVGILAGLTVSCKPEEAEKITVFELTQDYVNIAAEGGTASIAYTLENPLEGIKPLPETKADWINDFDDSQDGVITFSVAPNTAEESRDAIINVSYADIVCDFTVKQAGTASDEPPVTPFSITIKAIEATSVSASITAEDQNMSYFSNAVGAEDLNTYPDDITFVKEYLFEYLTLLAEQSQMTVEAVLDILLVKGDQDNQEVIGLNPETDYYVFCVGMDNQMEILSDFVKEAFTTQPYAPFDAEIEVSVDGPEATAIITPADNEDGWYCAAVEGHGLSEEEMQSVVESEIYTQVLNLMIWGASQEDAIAQLTLHGKDTVVFSNLKENTAYTVCAYTIDIMANATSSAAKTEITTKSADMSENVITVEFDQISSRRADFTVSPSNDDPYVFFAYQYSDDLKAMSDDEIIEKICSEYYMPNWIRHGAVSSYEERLFPDTEYIIFAFGYYGQKVTTELFKFPYSTHETEYDSSTFEYVYGPYYNGSEVYERYPELGDASGKAVMPASVHINGEYYEIHHIMYLGDLTDTEQYPDEMMYYGILDDYSYTSWDMTVLYSLTFGEVYTLFGFVEAENGNFSRLYRQLIGPYDEDGCSPIDEFNPYAAAAQSIAVPVICQDRVNERFDGFTVIQPQPAAWTANNKAGNTTNEYILPVTLEDGSRICSLAVIR